MSVNYYPPYSSLQRPGSSSPYSRDAETSMYLRSWSNSNSSHSAPPPPPPFGRFPSSPHFPVSPPQSASSSSVSSSPHLRGPLRRGKWTLAEEEYTAAMIQYFCSGTLGVPYGATLRSYLAQQLHCDPMRISKKLLPGSIVAGFKMMPKIGRRGYYPRLTRDSEETVALQQRVEQHLDGLRTAFIASLDALREEEDEYELLEARYRDYYQQRAAVASAMASMSITSSSSSPGGRKRRLFKTEWGVHNERASATYPSSRTRIHLAPTPYSGHHHHHHHHHHPQHSAHAHELSPVSRRQFRVEAPVARPHRVVESSMASFASSQQLPSLRVSLQRASVIMAAKRDR